MNDGSTDLKKLNDIKLF